MFSVQSTSRSGIQPLLPDDFGDEALAGKWSLYNNKHFFCKLKSAKVSAEDLLNVY